MWLATSTANTALGFATLQFVRGKANVALGSEALRNMDDGRQNVGIGNQAGYNLFDGDDNIYISNRGVPAESGVTRIGTAGIQTTTFIAGIRSSPVADAVLVAVTADGQLGVRTSSGRFKEAIEPLEKESEAILSLRPVKFRYKKEIDPKATAQFGLVAEEVEKVHPDLVARDEEGKPYSVHYEAVNAMLLNEFLKEHRTVQDLKATVTRQQKQIEALIVGLQKINAQVDLTKSSPQIVLNNQSGCAHIGSSPTTARSR